jgi:glutathione S-transferase
MEFGSPNPGRSYVTPNNVRLGDWLHEQCKKYKDGRLSESLVRTLNGFGVQFEKQRNIVGKRYTVATAIFAIHEYEKEHGHIKVNKTEDPHLYRWIIHAKAVSATIIEQGHGNVKFTLLHLTSLRKLGLIVLPHKFKL